MWIARIIVFFVAVIFGVEAASFVRYKTVTLDQEMEVSRQHKGIFEQRLVADGGDEREIPEKSDNKRNIPLVILSKPKATYTNEARENGVQGVVRLRITLLASVSVGGIEVIRRLPDGLTEQAIAAARKIEFEPKTLNGQSISVRVTFDYGFNIY